MPKALSPTKPTTGVLPLKPEEASDLLVRQIELDANTPTGEHIDVTTQRDTGRKRFKGKCHQRTRRG